MKSIYAFILLFLASFGKINCQTAPDFTFTDIFGMEHNLYNALDQGFIVLLDFFYKDCAPCHAAAPEIQEIFDDYAGKNVLIISLSDRDLDEDIFEFREALDIEYIQGGKDGGGKDIIHAYHDAFGLIGFPTVSVICPDGSLTWDIFPYSTGAPEWRSQIDSCGVEDWSNYEPIGTVPTASESLFFQENSFQIFPNPSVGNANIQVDLETESFIQISLFNTLGQFQKVVFDGILPSGNQNLELPVHDLPKGNYLLKIQKNSKEVKNLKFIKT